MDDAHAFSAYESEPAPLDDIMQKIAEHKGCGTTGGSGKASCGSGAGEGDMPAEIWEKVKNHPCYSEEAHHHYARMHVAVAPACNIQCNYCNRKYDCANESRPGVVSEKLTPEQAAKKVLAVASAIPQMTVLGIAGPGDPLANPGKTFKTFELISEAAPDIKLCLSTNGLALPDHVETIKRFNVDHVTITINMTDPDIGAEIYPWVFWKHKRVTGKEAAKILTDRQLQGLEMLTANGILCKVNSVMIPGINDDHLVTVNREVKSRGAFLHNIMPLISAPEHGTVFGLNGQRGPSAQELKALQDSCEGEMNMMRHCRQCRADAVGLLGEDRSAEFTTDKIMEMDVNYDLTARQAYQEKVEEERQAKVAARNAELEDSRRRKRRSQDPCRRRDQGQRPHQRTLRPCDRVPDLRTLDRGRQIRRSPPRRPLLPGRLWRGRCARNGHSRHQRLHRGLRRQDRPLSEGRSDQGRHRSGRSIRLRVHRTVGDRLLQGLSRQGEERRDHSCHARRRRHPSRRLRPRERLTPAKERKI